MPKRVEALPSLARMTGGHEPTDVSARPTGHIGDRSPNRRGVPDREGAPEEAGDLGAAQVPSERADLGDRVVGDRTVEREPRVERLEVAGEVDGRPMASHGSPGPGPGIYGSRARPSDGTAN